MLSNLTIDNYAIIDHLEINFESGLNIITGQTGAGKSILLGALGVLGGCKSDSGVLLDKAKNAVIEGVFEVGNYNLRQLFKQHEIDYADKITIRRIIGVNGKSRSFIDDVPVTNIVLKDFADKLIDIHSQHQSLLISHSDFQIKIIDSVGKQVEFVEKYKTEYLNLHALETKKRRIEQMKEQSSQRRDYLQHQVDQIEELKIKIGEFETLDNEHKSLLHASEITQSIGSAYGFLDDEERGVLLNLKRSLGYVSDAARHSALIDPLYDRLNSAYIDIKDVCQELQDVAYKIELNPDRLAEVEQRLDAINSVTFKHDCRNEAELMEVYTKMSEELEELNSGPENIDKLNQMIAQSQAKVNEMAEIISQTRAKAIPTIEQHTVRIMNQLGIKDTRFIVKCDDCQLSETGKNAVDFLFSANVVAEPMPIGKVASGGEIARLMLALKGIVSKSVKLPTIIFDEIDTGVSGGIADKMGEIISFMGTQMQVINITHLPQVASKGEHHFYVYKDKQTSIKKLSPTERIEKIAEMLSGANITDAAREQARQLLNVK